MRYNVLVDNLRSAVLQRIVGQAPLFNPRYKDFADHFGFTIAPCGVGQTHEKRSGEYLFEISR